MAAQPGSMLKLSMFDAEGKEIKDFGEPNGENDDKKPSSKSSLLNEEDFIRIIDLDKYKSPFKVLVSAEGESVEREYSLQIIELMELGLVPEYVMPNKVMTKVQKAAINMILVETAGKAVKGEYTVEAGEIRDSEGKSLGDNVMTLGKSFVKTLNGEITPNMQVPVKININLPEGINSGSFNGNVKLRFRSNALNTGLYKTLGEEAYSVVDSVYSSVYDIGDGISESIIILPFTYDVNIIAPDAPLLEKVEVIDPITRQVKISGVANENAKLIIRVDDKILGMLAANQEGTFEKKIALEHGKHHIYVTEINNFGNESKPSRVFELGALISFKNGKDEVLKTLYLEDGREVDYPDVPSMFGYTFIGWDKTTDEIKTASEDLVVTALYKKNEDIVSVNVYEGKGSGTFNLKDVVTVEANAPQAGKKFSHWEDQAGNIMCYNTVYKFYASRNIELTAVFMDVTAGIEKKANIAITRVTKTDDKISFVAERVIPEGYTIITHGMIVTKNSQTGASDSDFKLGGTDVLKGESKTKALIGTLVVNKVAAVDETWYARGFVTYKDSSENEFTIYSDIVKETRVN